MKYIFKAIFFIAYWALILLVATICHTILIIWNFKWITQKEINETLSTAQEVYETLFI